MTETGNIQLVSVQGDRIWILNPKRDMSRQEALNLAAWLVALANSGSEFVDTLRAIQAT